MKKILPENAKLIPPNASRVFDGRIFDVYQWPQKMYDGSTQTFEMLKRPDTVEVLAVKGDRIVVLEEEQPDTVAYYATPGGRHDVAGETELEGAKRELLEETGMSFKTWRLLKVFQPVPKIEYFVYQFLATEFESQHEPHVDVGEKIAVQLVSFEELKKLLDSPKNRYLPKDLLDQAESLEQLLDLPEFVGKVVDR